MSDDDGTAGGRELVGNGARRFIDVDQYVRWPQSAQLLDIDGLGAADARHRPDPGRGMYAEGCAPDHPFAQAKVEQQLGQTRHERDDACRVGRYRAVLGADCIQRRRRHHRGPGVSSASQRPACITGGVYFLERDRDHSFAPLFPPYCLRMEVPSGVLPSLKSTKLGPVFAGPFFFQSGQSPVLAVLASFGAGCPLSVICRCRSAPAC